MYSPYRMPMPPGLQMPGVFHNSPQHWPSEFLGQVQQPWGVTEHVPPTWNKNAWTKNHFFQSFQLPQPANISTHFQQPWNIPEHLPTHFHENEWIANNFQQPPFQAPYHYRKSIQHSPNRFVMKAHWERKIQPGFTNCANCSSNLCGDGQSEGEMERYFKKIVIPRPPRSFCDKRIAYEKRITNEPYIVMKPKKIFVPEMYKRNLMIRVPKVTYQSVPVPINDYKLLTKIVPEPQIEHRERIILIPKLICNRKLVQSRPISMNIPVS